MSFSPNQASVGVCSFMYMFYSDISKWVIKLTQIKLNGRRFWISRSSLKCGEEVGYMGYIGSAANEKLIGMELVYCKDGSQNFCFVEICLWGLMWFCGRYTMYISTWNCLWNSVYLWKVLLGFDGSLCSTWVKFTVRFSKSIWNFAKNHFESLILYSFSKYFIVF